MSHNGFANSETYRFVVLTENTQTLYAAIRDYVDDCRRRVPGMTPLTIGTNVKLAVRGWVDMARQGEPIRNVGWGPAGELPIPPATLRELADHVGDLSAVSERDLGDRWSED